MPFDLDVELSGFERTEGQYGPKLEFEVQGDTAVWEELIDNCEWKGETFHRNLYGDVWEIDRTPKALDAIERETGVEIPKNKLVPEGQRAIFKIPKGSLYIKLEDVSSGVKEIVREELSYEVTYYDRESREEKSYYDNLIFREGIPIGMKDRLERLLEDLDINGMLVDYREEPDLFNIDFEWNFPHELRDYQKRGLSRMMQGSCIIQWPTGAGKTIGALRTVQQMGVPTLVLVHQTDLLEQWCREIREVLGVEPGVVQQDREEFRDITVAMIPTLHNRIEDRSNYKIDDFDMVITDEVHHLQADTWLDVALKTNAYYRYGLSATIGEQMEKSDGHTKKIIAGIGPNDISISPEYLISEGYLARPHFEWLYPKRVRGEFDDWQEAYKQAIVHNDDRNDIIVDRAEELMDSHRNVLIDVDRINHGETLIGKFSAGLHRTTFDPDDPKDLDYDFDPQQCTDWPIPVVHDGDTVWGYSSTGDPLDALEMAIEDHPGNPVLWISGKDGSETREFVLQEFRSQKIGGVVSTLLREGVDVPKLDTVILAGGGKSPIQLIQTVGRSLRPEGENDSLVIDCKDNGPYVGNHAYKRYQALQEYYGRYCDSKPSGWD